VQPAQGEKRRGLVPCTPEGYEIHGLHLTVGSNQLGGEFAPDATIASFITSPLHVPVRSLFAEGKEVDGEEACKIAWAIMRNDAFGNMPRAKGQGRETEPQHACQTGGR
jgi:hypothetical protein